VKINNLEIRVIAMRRSGHHAIINWIRGLFKDTQRVCFINEISSLHTPLKQCSFTGFSKEEIHNDINGNFVKKDALILNFEEASVKELEKKLKICNSKGFYPRGGSKKILNVLVLRDPYNNFASRLALANQLITKEKERGRTGGKHCRMWISDKKVELWCEHARNFLSHPNLICINYNNWFSDIEYRKSVALKLGLKFRDNNRNQVAKEGGGSSFDGLTKQNKAREMNVLNRWKNFKHDKTYKGIISDPELIDLSNKIFGKIA